MLVHIVFCIKILHSINQRLFCPQINKGLLHCEVVYCFVVCRLFKQHKWIKRIEKQKKVKFHFIVNIQCLCIIIQITYFFVEVFCIRFYNVRLRMQSRSSHKKLSVIVIISVTWCLFHYINDFRYRPNIYKSLYRKCCWATLIFCTLVVQYSATK